MPTMHLKMTPMHAKWAQENITRIGDSFNSFSRSQSPTRSLIKFLRLKQWYLRVLYMSDVHTCA